MLAPALKALRDSFSAPLRRVMWQSILLGIALLVLIGVIAQWALGALPETGIVWIDVALEIFARFFAVIMLVPLMPVVTAAIAGFFLEDVAAKIEARDYPQSPPGRDQPFVQSLRIALLFALGLLIINLLALPLYLIPGVNVVVFWVVNGYLLGREYFELVALRHVSPREVRKLREDNSLRMLGVGMLIALLMTIPFVNLMAPLFATALMVHVYKELAREGT